MISSIQNIPQDKKNLSKWNMKQSFLAYTSHKFDLLTYKTFLKRDFSVPKDNFCRQSAYKTYRKHGFLVSIVP